MSLKIYTKIPYGTVRYFNIQDDDDAPEVHFTPDPQDQAEALWFCFRLVEHKPRKDEERKLKLVLRYYETLRGAVNPAHCMPVYHPKDQGWFRMKAGTLEKTEDSQLMVSWQIPYPAPSTEVALCFPYGKPEIETLVHKSKGTWRTDIIGITSHGRDIVRLSNDLSQPDAHRPGLYILARQNRADTPASWVLDGMLQQFSKVRNNPYVIWVVPLANTDGVIKGDREPCPGDLFHTWGLPVKRHENEVLLRDIERWRVRCKPSLVLDLRSPGLDHVDGLFAWQPEGDGFKDMHDQAVKRANEIKTRLSSDFAADAFNHPYPVMVNDFFSAMRACDLCTLSLQVPFAMAGGQILSQKNYREAGKRIAETLLAK